MTQAERTTVSVTEELDQYSSLVQDALTRRLDRLRSTPWLDDLIGDYPARGGKALRPAILLATCQAHGGTIAEAMNAAISIELLHNAFLIHDDIEDDSELRRGEPTLHRIHGIPLALNAGDSLAVIALEQLRSDDGLGSRLSQLLTDEFNQMARRTIEGQANELGWRRDGIVDLTPDDYLDLVGRKTCWYTTIYPLRAGALIGSRATAPLTDLNHFGFYLGAAFQIRDDLLNLIGSEERVGKELYGDLREGKRTLMLIHLLEHARPADREFLLAFLRQPEDDRSAEQLIAVRDLMVEYGSIDFATEYGRGIAVAAYKSFDAAFRRVPQSSHVDFLRELVTYMLDRDL